MLRCPSILTSYNLENSQRCKDEIIILITGTHCIKAVKKAYSDKRNASQCNGFNLKSHKFPMQHKIPIEIANTRVTHYKTEKRRIIIYKFKRSAEL